MESITKEQQAKANRLTKDLRDYKVNGNVVAVRSGPIVTTFEFQPEPGIKAAKIAGLAIDIARCMQVQSARVTQVPGSAGVGVELPNTVREVVSLPELMRTTA